MDTRPTVKTQRRYTMLEGSEMGFWPLPSMSAASYQTGSVSGWMSTERQSSGSWKRMSGSSAGSWSMRTRARGTSASNTSLFYIEVSLI